MRSMHECPMSLSHVSVLDHHEAVALGTNDLLRDAVVPGVRSYQAENPLDVECLLRDFVRTPVVGCLVTPLCPGSEVAVHLGRGEDVGSRGSEGLHGPVDEPASALEADPTVRCSEREQ